MKKILILAYYYPPCNGIAAQRPKSFATYFSRDHEVKVITRNWIGNEKIWTDYLASSQSQEIHSVKSENLEEIYLPYKKNEPSKLKLLTGLISGDLHQEIDTSQFYSEAKKLVQNWKPDIILATAPPLNILKLAKQLSKINNSKIVADFRDFENYHILTNKKHTLKENLFHYSNKQHTLSFLKQASLITTVSPAISSFFLAKKLPTYTITNGYERELFDKLSKNKTSNKTFTLSLIGTLYEAQKIDLILHLLKEFKKGKRDVTINFIGTAENTAIQLKINSILGHEQVNVTHKVDRNEALHKMAESHVLFYMGWEGFKGVYSGKIFEYLGMKRNILIVPNDNDVIETIVNETNSGLVSTIEDTVLTYLTAKYQEWIQTGEVEYYGDHSKIEFYSREQQAELLLTKILTL